MDSAVLLHCEITGRVTRAGTAGQGKGCRTRPWEDQFRSTGSLASGLHVQSWLLCTVFLLTFHPVCEGGRFRAILKMKKLQPTQFKWLGNFWPQTLDSDPEYRPYLCPELLQKLLKSVVRQRWLWTAEQVWANDAVNSTSLWAQLISSQKTLACLYVIWSPLKGNTTALGTGLTTAQDSPVPPDSHFCSQISEDAF